MRAIAETADGNVTIVDGPFDFTHQIYHDIDDVQLKKGDALGVHYQNDTNKTGDWGNSSEQEMCFLSIGLYPAVGYGQLPCFY